MSIEVGMGEGFLRAPKEQPQEVASPLRKSIVEFLKGLFSIGTYDIYKAAKFRKEIKGVYHPKKAEETQQERISIIRNSLLLLQTKSLDELKDRVGGGVNRHIQKKMQSILERFQDQNEGVRNHALKEGENLMAVLKKRSNKQLGIEIAKTAIKITAIVVAVLLIFSPISVVLLSILGGAVIVGIGIEAYKKKKLDMRIFSLPLEISVKTDFAKFEAARVHKAQGNFELAYISLRQAYGKAEDHFPPGIKKRLLEFERDKQFDRAYALFEHTIDILSHAQKRLEYEHQGTELLAKAIIRKELKEKPEKKKKGAKEEVPLEDAPLRPPEREQLTDFLYYAEANKDLNMRMQGISEPSLAETFLARFSHKTKSMNEFEKVLKKAQKFLQQEAPQELIKSEAAMEVATADLQARLKAFTSEKGPLLKIRKISNELAEKMPKVESLSNVMKAFDVIEKHMQNIQELEKELPFVNAYDPEHFLSWYQKTQSLMKQVALDINTILQDPVFVALVKPKKGQRVQEVSGFTKDQVVLLRKLKDNLNAARKEVEGRIKNLDNEVAKIGTILQNIQLQVQKLPGSIQEPFSLQDIFLLDTFKKLGETCPYHRSMPILRDLYAKCSEAEGVLEGLNCVLQCSSGYKPGAITFLDEQFKARFEGKPAFHEKGIWKKGVFWKEVLKVPEKGPFTIQPFFTGSLTHAALVNVQENMFTLCEIVDRFANSDIFFAEATYSKAFTPNFHKIVTPDGLKKLKEHFPGKSDDEILKEIRFRFERKLSRLIHEEHDRLKDIQLAHWKAGVAILPRFSRVSRTTEQDRSLHIDTQMFCSEFVSMMMTSAFTRVEDDLLKELHLERPFHLFHEIIPKDVPFEKVHPNRLENFLKAYFEPVPTPPLVRALIKERA